MENFFKKFKPVDLIIVAGVLIALVVGFLTYKNFRQTASKQIEATSQISFDVFIRGITYTGSEALMKAGEKTFISIRNVPYSDLEIINVRMERKKTVLPILMPSKKVQKNVLIVDDISQSNLYDIVVTLTDTAKITKDGAVVGGNKIKIGLPITLEGENYKFNGTVSDLKVAHYNPEDELNSQINNSDDIQ